jgi:hypothetical protein
VADAIHPGTDEYKWKLQDLEDQSFQRENAYNL